MGALLRADTRWRRVFELGPWSLWQTGETNAFHWTRFCVRLNDGLARRRSWWINWSHEQQRLAVDDVIEDLERRHSDFHKQLLRRLRAWRP